MMLGDKPRVDVNAIPTGSIGLDAALGVGGVPRGRIIEIFGPESSGKTTLTLHIIAEAQKKGGICAFIEAEHAMDPEYAARLGVKTKELLCLVASAVLRCDDCVKYHLETCFKIGVTKVEMMESMGIATLVGGTIVIPHLRRAYEFWEALEESVQ